MIFRNIVCAIALCSASVGLAHEVQSERASLTKAEEAAFLGGITPRLSDLFVLNIAAELCGILQNTSFTINYPVAEALERNLLRYAEIAHSDPLKEAKIVAFWNNYADRMICPAHAGFYPRQHFYKRAIEMRISRAVLEEYFFRDPLSFPIKVNVVEVLDDGRRSTLIDYIDAALAMDEAEDRYNIDQVEDLREYLIDSHGAKRFGDM